MRAGIAPERDQLRMMTGPHPFGPEALVTLENWQRPPYNRWAFQHVRELIPTALIPCDDGPARKLPRAERDLSEIRFATESGEGTVGELLLRSYTDGFLVIHQGAIITEQYFNGLRPGTPHLLMSVSKSITGLVAGALAGKGALDVTAPVEAIVPELAGTSFAGARVQHLLDMRTGTRFVEDYDDPDAEITVGDRVYLWRPDEGKPRPACGIEYFATLANDGPHGGPFRYRSILIDVLAWVLEKAGGARFSDLVSQELWRPMGAEHDAEITVDAHGNALADGGISATLRDVGRVGLLALRGGVGHEGQVIFPEAWLDDTIAGGPDGPAAFSAGEGATGYPPGAHYRNCWWVIDPALPLFYASGIYGQHIFVHVPSQTVVVKLSSWPEAVSDEMRRAAIGAVLAIADCV
jgi:CubicO group peptidase (beta-lactamase class C family)